MEKQIFGREKKTKNGGWLEKKQILGVEKMGVGKTNIDLDGQLTNFPGQTKGVEAQGLAQLVASSSRPLVVAASKFLH